MILTFLASTFRTDKSGFSVSRMIVSALSTDAVTAVTGNAGIRIRNASSTASIFCVRFFILPFSFADPVGNMKSCIMLSIA